MNWVKVCIMASACGWLGLSGGEFITESGIVPSKGISDDGKVLILRSAPGADEKSFFWRPPEVPVDIPDLDGGATRVRALAIAGSGKTVVGWSSSARGDSEAIRWTMGGGTVALGDLPTGWFRSEAIGCNYSGSFTFGTGNVALDGYRTQAVVWGAEANITGLGFLPGGEAATTPFDCSEDGTIVVGSGFTDSGAETFIWNSIDGLINLGLIPNVSGTPVRENSPLACSRGGDRIVGFGYDEGYGYVHGPITIWTWSDSAGFKEVAEAPGDYYVNGPPIFRPNALVSDDLNTIVAEYASHGGDGILRWIKGSGVEELELIGKSMSIRDMSADGRVIVGRMVGLDDVVRAVLWGPDGKAHILKDFLDANGTDTGATELEAANAVSADGHTFAGSLPYVVGNPPGAFYATISDLWIYDESIDDIWRESPWYGLYALTIGEFIWHEEHGFQIPVPDSAGAMFVFDSGLDCWYWTSPEVYPFFYKYGFMEGWMHYYLGSTPGQRWFYAVSEEMPISEDELSNPAP